MHAIEAVRHDRRRRGFTLIDAMVGMFILAVGSLSLAALMPTMARSQKMSHEMSVATQIANREMEQLRLAGYNNLTYTGLRAVNLLDVYGGAGPYTFTGINLDNASHLSAGTALKNGVGEVAITQLTSDVRQITITVRWTSASNKARNVSISTMLGKDA